MNPQPRLTVRDLRVRAVNVPMAIPLQTSSGTIGVAPLALIDLHTEEGVTGAAYLFCYTPLVLKPVVQLLANLAPLVKGDAVAPLALERKLQGRFRLLGAERAAAEAQQLAAPGFAAIKVRLGYPDLKTDLAVVRAVQRAVGDDVLLMSDYNQVLPVPEAIARVQALDGEGLGWIEEPALADDYEGYARIREKARTPIQMGENWWGTHEMAKCLAVGATDLGMPDAMKIGGVSGWLRAAAFAEAAGLPVSSHLFPEVSAHLLAVSPTCHWLEYVDWAAPILQTPLRIEDGHAVVPDAPGSGIAWNEDGVARYLAE